MEEEYNYQSDDYAEYPEDEYSHSQPVKYIDYTQPEAEQDVLFQRSNTYYILDPTLTNKYIKDMVTELQETWGVSEGFALKILRKYAWQKEKALDHLAEELNSYNAEVSNKDNSKEFDCPICYSTEPIYNACSFGCNHFYCRDCFMTFIKVSIEEKEPLKSCPTAGCPEVLTPAICEKYLGGDSLLFNKYKEFLVQTIIDTSSNLVWCPGVQCPNVIQLLKMKKDEQLLLNIRCNCGHSFCFACRDTAHRPIHCDKFAKWITLIGGKDDSLNANWINKNSKKCPTCKVSIEKNQGCMHMTCRNCSHQFCWLCLGDWKTHGAETGGFYNCNKYKPSDEGMDDKQKEFEKFNFYRDRYEQHWNSLKYAMKKKQIILQNFKELNFQVVTPKDDFFLREALDLVIEARRAITMTYAIGYFTKFDSLGKDMYEMQQSFLWDALDGLDKFTDQLQSSETIESLLVDIVQGSKNFSLKFNAFKLQLGGIIAGVTAACNKLLNYIEGELQNKQSNFEGNKLEDDNMLYPQVTEELNNWYCAYCTYFNGKEDATCGMCNQAKAVHEGNIF